MKSGRDEMKHDKYRCEVKLDDMIVMKMKIKKLCHII